MWIGRRYSRENEKKERYVDTEDVVHTHEGYYSVTKENGLMPFTAIWMDLEIIILSEGQKRKYKYKIPLICGT